MGRKGTGLIICAGLSVLAAPAMAQEGRLRAGSPDFIAVGAGVVPQYAGSDQYQVIPYGAFSLRAGPARISSLGPSLQADLLDRSQAGKQVKWQFGPTLGLRGGRSADNIDNTAIAALGEIGTTVEAGVFAGVARSDLFATHDRLGFNLRALHDVGGVYDDWSGSASLTYTFATPRTWTVASGLSASWASNGLNERYFSITPTQSLASGLPQYTARSGIDRISLNTTVIRNFRKSPWFAGFAGSAGKLVGDAADSPIVAQEGSSTQLIGGLFLGRRF